MITQTTHLTTPQDASPEYIEKSLAAAYAGSRWHLPYADGICTSSSALTFSAFEDGVVTNLGQRSKEDLRSMASSLIHSLQKAGFCNQDAEQKCILDVATGSLTIPARTFKRERLDEVMEAVSSKESLNQFCRACDLNTSWEISQDFRAGIHLQTYIGHFFVRQDSMLQQTLATLADGSLEFFEGPESSPFQYYDKRLTGGLTRAFIVVGIIEKAADMKLSQDFKMGMYCDSDEIPVALRLPIDKIVGLSGALGYVERNRLSKPVYSMTARVVPFIEDFVRSQIQQRAAGGLAADRSSVAVQSDMSRHRLQVDTFKVLAQPMTVAIPSVNVEVHFKNSDELTVCEQSFRAGDLEVRTEESTENGFVGTVRILNCSAPRFKDFLETTIRKSLKGAWSEAGEGASAGD